MRNKTATCAVCLQFLPLGFRPPRAINEAQYVSRSLTPAIPQWALVRIGTNAAICYPRKPWWQIALSVPD